MTKRQSIPHVPSTQEIIQQARALIAKPDTYTTGAFARDSCGRSIPYDMPSCMSWNLFGALARAADGQHKKRLEAMDVVTQVAVKELAWPESVALFYDKASHKETLWVLDRAIELLDGRGTA